MTLEADIQVYPLQNPHVILVTQKTDSVVLMDPVSGMVIKVNSVGLAIWKSLDGATSLDELIKNVYNKFSDVPADAETEVTEFVTNLIKKGFIGFSIESTIQE